MSEDVPASLRPPVELALAKAINAVPAEGSISKSGRGNSAARPETRPRYDDGGARLPAVVPFGAARPDSGIPPLVPMIT
ncbi:hypothetical protein DXK94_17360 [Arthrobacter sp. RT-1]|nr:hypothetical protein DXK94_17360 [Arthrobacter sp. RT-1]